MNLFLVILEKIITFLCCVFILLVSVIVVFVFSIYIKIYDGGNIFYRPDMVGADGKIFRMFKLRTMKLNASEILENQILKNPSLNEEWHQYEKIISVPDPRVAGFFSSFLRKTSLDETVQIFNVLAGDMSLVGPRPMTINESLKVEESAALLRNKVRPGITGLWQVSGRNTIPFQEMINIDLDYIRSKKPLSNIYIILKTSLVFFDFRKTS